MYLTKDEAAKKICPHMMYCINERDVVTQNTPPLMTQGNCYTDQCMAWRWAGGIEVSGKGYCGLSGRPGPFHDERATT